MAQRYEFFLKPHNKILFFIGVVKTQYNVVVNEVKRTKSTDWAMLNLCSKASVRFSKLFV